MKPATPKQNGRREYHKHGDSHRERLQKERRSDEIDGRSSSMRRANKWQRFAFEKKGKDCSPDIREKIEAGKFYLWRTRELRTWIEADAANRGTPINRRRGTLPKSNEQHDALFERWMEINDELELDKGRDIAKEFMLKARANGGQR